MYMWKYYNHDDNILKQKNTSDKNINKFIMKKNFIN